MCVTHARTERGSGSLQSGVVVSWQLMNAPWRGVGLTVADGTGDTVGDAVGDGRTLGGAVGDGELERVLPFHSQPTPSGSASPAAAAAAR